MKSKILIYVFLITLVFIFANKTSAQENTSDVWGGDDFGSLHLPTNTQGENEFLRALFIYVTFRDDNEPNPTYGIWATPDSDPNTPGTRPMNPYTKRGNIVGYTKRPASIPFMNRYETYTISDFFCQMSGGRLDFIGDEVYFKLPYYSYEYQQMGWTRPQLNSYVLQYVHDILGVNFTNYDNWHQSGGSWVWGGDGEAEMIVIQYRKIPSPYENYFWGMSGVGGEAHLFGDGTTLTFDGVLLTNDDGITATQGINRTTHLELVLEHEISHHIFGGYFNHPGYNCWHVSIGMMTPGHNTSTYCMVPMERAMPGLDWLTPMIANPEAPPQVFTLRDEFEYGDALKVPIPKQYESDPQEYLWVTNHQKKSRFDGVSRGSNTCWNIDKNELEPYCDVGKGLFIFHESDKYCMNNWNNGSSYPFDIKSAKGRWNWDLDTTVFEFNQWFNIQKTTNRNIYTGLSTYNKFMLRPNEWSAQFLTRDICWNPPNYKVTFEFHGDGKDPFNMGYDEILSPYSNSSSNNYQSPQFNTGLTIRLLSQNTAGDMQVKVYYNDNTALSECPPAKPQNLKVTPVFPEDLQTYYARLDWESNLEPDLTGDSYYKIYKGVSYNCDNEPSQYSFLATAPISSTEYIDYSVLLHYNGIGSQNCGNMKKTVSYKITAVDVNGNESVKSERSIIQGYYFGCIMDPGIGDNSLQNKDIPKTFNMKQNYPNPFNPVTNIQYDIPKDVLVSLKIYDITGREIKTLVSEFKNAGSYIVTFNGSEFASGVYFYRIQAGNYVQVKRMVLIK